MNKVILALVVAVGAMSLTACGGFSDSPEQKAFKAFVEKCKKDPSTADCKAWKESTNSPGGN
jgi:hypothetical protein